MDEAMSEPAELVAGEKFPGSELAALRPAREGFPEGKWWFRCDCGTEKVFARYQVRHGLTKTCGCGQTRRALAKRKFTPEMIQAIRDRYATEGSALAKEFGIGVTSLWRKAQALGVKIPGTELRATTRRARNTSCNHEFFKTWSPELAYLLGYTWADGCVAQRNGRPKSINFQCVGDDRELLEQIRTVTGTKQPVRDIPGITIKGTLPDTKDRTYQCRPAARLIIHSADVADILVREHGIVPRKSRVDAPYPTNIPNELLSHFARGNFDGDGCLSIVDTHEARMVTFIFLGSSQFLLGMTRQISRVVGIKEPVVTSRQGCSRATWGAKVDALKLCKWLYKDATIFLARKKDKADLAAKLIPEWLLRERKPKKPHAMNKLCNLFTAMCERCHEEKPKCATMDVTGTNAWGDAETRAVVLCVPCRRKVWHRSKPHPVHVRER